MRTRRGPIGVGAIVPGFAEALVRGRQLGLRPARQRPGGGDGGRVVFLPERQRQELHGGPGRGVLVHAGRLLHPAI